MYQPTSQLPTCPWPPCGAQSPLGAKGEPNVSSAAPVKWTEQRSHMDSRPRVSGSSFRVGDLTQEFGVPAHFGVRALCHHYSSPCPLCLLGGLPEPRAASTTASLCEGKAPRSSCCQERLCARHPERLGIPKWVLWATHRSLWSWEEERTRRSIFIPGN